jgi:hypothetical protein
MRFVANRSAAFKPQRARNPAPPSLPPATPPKPFGRALKRRKAATTATVATMTEESYLGCATAASSVSSSGSSSSARQQQQRRRRRSSRRARRLIDEADYEGEEEEEASAMDVGDDDEEMGNANSRSSTKPSPPPCRWAHSSASASASAASSAAAPMALLPPAHPHAAHEPVLSSERRALGLTGLLAHAAGGDAARFAAAAKRVGDDAKAWARTDVHGRGVLHLAADGGHSGVLREALASKMLPVDQEVAAGGNGHGATALTYALARRDVEAAVLLLAEGALCLGVFVLDVGID